MSIESVRQRVLIPVVKTGGYFGVHLCIGTFGVMVVSGVLVFFLYSFLGRLDPYFSANHASWLLTEVSGFPVQATIGFFLGLQLAKWMRYNIMIWTWVLPFALFCAIAITSPYHGSFAFTHFMGNGCSPKKGCFDQFVTTLPLVASCTYSAGAAMGSRFYCRPRRGDSLALRAESFVQNR